MHGTFRPARLLRVTCSYCNCDVRSFGANQPRASHKRQMLRTVDHIIPQHRGGTGQHDNLRIACTFCNEARAITGDCIAALAYAQAAGCGRSLPRVIAWWRQAQQASRDADLRRARFAAATAQGWGA